MLVLSTGTNQEHSRRDKHVLERFSGLFLSKSSQPSLVDANRKKFPNTPYLQLLIQDAAIALSK